jgi:hypothetical protein
MKCVAFTNSAKETNTRVHTFTGFKLAAVIIAAAGLFAFSSLRSGSIKGTVSPADGAARVWAESSTDTVKELVINGAYEISDVKPGTYNIIIEAKPPYKNAAKNGVAVNDGQAADAGEIKLEK